MQDGSALRSISRSKMDHALLICSMDRHHFLVTLPSLAAARALLGADGQRPSRIGLCSFSCLQLGKSVGKEGLEVKFRDAGGFYRYARELCADGVHTSMLSTDPALAEATRRPSEPIITEPPSMRYSQPAKSSV